MTAANRELLREVLREPSGWSVRLGPGAMREHYLLLRKDGRLRLIERNPDDLVLLAFECAWERLTGRAIPPHTRTRIHDE